MKDAAAFAAESDDDMARSITIRGSVLKVGDPVYWIRNNYDQSQYSDFSVCTHELPFIQPSKIAAINPDGTQFAFANRNGRWVYVEEPESYCVTAAEAGAALEQARRDHIFVLKAYVDKCEADIVKLRNSVARASAQIIALDEDNTLDGEAVRALFPTAQRFYNEKASA